MSEECAWRMRALVPVARGRHVRDRSDVSQSVSAHLRQWRAAPQSTHIHAGIPPGGDRGKLCGCSQIHSISFTWETRLSHVGSSRLLSLAVDAPVTERKSRMGDLELQKNREYKKF
jgi:hypothetical protein